MSTKTQIKLRQPDIAILLSRVTPTPVEPPTVILFNGLDTVPPLSQNYLFPADAIQAVEGVGQHVAALTKPKIRLFLKTKQ